MVLAAAKSVAEIKPDVAGVGGGVPGPQGLIVCRSDKPGLGRVDSQAPELAWHVTLVQHTT